MKTLVIGYGNTLRGDDGVGYRLAEAFEHWRPEVEAYPCHQLTPELAEAIAQVDRVIFVDATPPQNPHSPLVLERLVERDYPAFFTGHHSSPTALLTLTQQLYGRRPLAYAFLLPTWEMGYSEALSAIAEIGLNQGIKRLQEFLGLDGGEDGG
ncbi:MAG TPA: hydrogenase maturation protease [Leptolyngbyaceae cyanobacterium M65_K2018_010]|nr:hydrogenase maturation protease [Leptolyngbyaceae cyanobacterium M65_K2018_010]